MEINENDEGNFISKEDFDSKYALRVMLILSGLVLIVMYIEGMLTPSLPHIAHQFNISPAQASLLLSTYLIGGVALTPIIGKLGDLYGKKKMLTIVLIIYSISVSITGFSPSYNFMIAARTIQGIGLTIMPLGMSLVREEFPREYVPKAQALISAMFGVGFAISIPLGSLISNDFGWRMTYHTAIPFVVFLAVITFIMVKESRFRRPEVKIDFIGATLLAGSLASIVFALSEGQTWGWYSFYTLGLAFTGFILLIPLLIYERNYSMRGGEAIIHFKLLSNRNVMVANITISISGMGMFLAMQALSYRFELPSPSGFGLSILGTGLSLVPFAIGIFIMAIVTGKVVSRVGVKPLAILGGILASVAFFMMAFSNIYNEILFLEFFTGCGLSLMNASLINLIVLTVNPKDMGLATAMNGTFRSVGSSIGAPIAGSIMSALSAIYIIGVTSKGSIYSNPMPTPSAYFVVFMISSAAFATAAIISLSAREVLGKRKFQNTDTMSKRQDIVHRNQSSED
ncbi:MAG: MFS transporter [Thermoplasmataceae archaeon]